MKELNSSNFSQEVLQSDMPVLVDFYADWCVPCQMLAPVMQQLAEEFAGKVTIVKLNVDQAPELVSSLGIDGIPALLYFKNGQVKGASVGFTHKEALTRKLNEWEES